MDRHIGLVRVKIRSTQYSSSLEEYLAKNKMPFTRAGYAKELIGNRPVSFYVIEFYEDGALKDVMALNNVVDGIADISRLASTIEDGAKYVSAQLQSANGGANRIKDSLLKETENAILECNTYPFNTAKVRILGQEQLASSFT
ncbi:hypothetical protein EPN87_02170 [archaeon]|nr:MAG: hypothetical protein EPN87_02170 [archaeon]